MKITWLGQAGFLFETLNRKILIDPYLSNSVEKVQPQNRRRVMIDERFLEIKPDVIVLTHNHLDHTDPETLVHYLKENASVTVLASQNAYENVRKFGALGNNYVCFNEGSIWTESGLKFSAIKAEHSDSHAIGVIINYQGKNYYHTGDTLYNEKIFSQLNNKNIDVLFLPINGVGNNMNVEDAIAFAKRVSPEVVIPMHFGMFDDIKPPILYFKTIIPKEYQMFEV